MSIESINTGTLNNYNNKFGVTCNCVGMGMTDNLFTNYTSHSIFNDNIYKQNNITNSHEYRTALQNNAETIIKNEQKRYDDNKCIAKNNEIFYIDSSSYNFDIPLVNPYNGPKSK